MITNRIQNWQDSKLADHQFGVYLVCGFLPKLTLKILALCVVLVCSVIAMPRAVADSVERPLNGEWQFQREGAGDKWKTVTLPNNFEEHEGENFDGVGIYKKTIPPIRLPAGTRAVLHFQAVATLAEVWFDGKKIGTHLGGWTPFRFDITEPLSAAGNRPHEIRVRVDEKVGHNSQGFLPVFAPHFGGIWQEAKLLIVPTTWIDDLGVMAIGDVKTGCIRLEIPMRGESSIRGASLRVRYRLNGSAEWSEAQVEDVKLNDRRPMAMEVPVKGWELWSPAAPNLYELEIRLCLDTQRGGASEKERTQTVFARAGFRTIEVDGRALLLNGKPLAVRGVLNWGYAPPRVAPSIDEEHFRRELEFARSYGFNLMKFCLWIPPRRYLEIADEMGMLAWVEYPTWHSKWTPDQLPTLRKEFVEFFRYDRNHPSVVLRSLTCETGPSADLDVIRNLYDLGHEMVPGSVVEDDSSWIAWNRVHDFYDDHPYGNNDSWVQTLDRLKEHIEKHGAKPLVLGEAIAADTWVDQETILDAVGEMRPAWLPNYLDGNEEWIQRMGNLAGPDGLDRLEADSKHYALLMRKYQIETYRREVPDGGYVVSVIRDFPFASMGLLDYLDRPKWSATDWNWHRDTMLLLATESDRRSYTSGDKLRADVLISHFGNEAIQGAKLSVTIERRVGDEFEVISKNTKDNIEQPLGTLKTSLKLDVPLPDVDEPTQLNVRATLRGDDGNWTNTWLIWVMPLSEQPTVVLRESIKREFAAGVFDHVGPFPEKPGNEVVVARRLDLKLIDYLEAGGRVLLLPDGGKSSFPLSNEWFLRGAPYIPSHAFSNSVPRELLIELQHFDLASSVVPDIDYLEQIDPILMLWHNHDIRRVKTHGLVFETQVGRGRLLVSALRHNSETHSVGRWLLSELLKHVAGGPQPIHSFTNATIRELREKVNAKKIELVEKTWRFKPDPDNNGLANQWHLSTTPLDDSWNQIRVGRAWEGLGYPKLDGWAWYRIVVEIPADWQGLPVFISLEGIDDHYELYVNGELSGTGGDIKTKSTAFDERKSHDVSEFAQPGKPLHIAFRVYNWYGAGGIHRPVTIGTARIGTGNGILK